MLANALEAQVQIKSLSCHHSSSHGNGQRLKGVDKMETGEDSSESLIDGVCACV